MTTTTLKQVDELEPGDTFSFSADDDDLYVLVQSDFNASSVQPVVLIYVELGAPANEVNRTSHEPNEVVEVWSA
jgi:hypothetical protein